jgi:hypothetical protein
VDAFIAIAARQGHGSLRDAVAVWARVHDLSGREGVSAADADNRCARFFDAEIGSPRFQAATAGSVSGSSPSSARSTRSNSAGATGLLL